MHPRGEEGEGGPGEEGQILRGTSPLGPGPPCPRSVTCEKWPLLLALFMSCAVISVTPSDNPPPSTLQGAPFYSTLEGAPLYSHMTLIQC